MQKNIDKRKKLEEEEIKLGFKRPKKNYGGFSDDENEMDQTKKEKAKISDENKMTLKRKINKQEEEGEEEEGEGDEQAEDEAEEEP